MKSNKITKGYYRVEIENTQAFIQKVDDLEGDLIWMISFANDQDQDLAFDHFQFDQLWKTKSEAIYNLKFMIQSMINYGKDLKL